MSKRKNKKKQQSTQHDETKQKKLLHDKLLEKSQKHNFETKTVETTNEPTARSTRHHKTELNETKHSTK